MAGDEPSSVPPHGGRLLSTLAFVLTAWVCFTFSFTPLRTSHDEWWHLKTGQWIAANGLPEHDIFTYTAENIEWHNHEWLTQLMMWNIFRAGGGKVADEYGGILALVAFKTLIIILAFCGFGLLLARRMQEPICAALAAALAVALARRAFYPRPPFITYLLLTLLLWFFVEWRAGRMRERTLWLVVPLFALWSNLHGGWMAGLLVVGAFWADQAYSTAIAWKRGEAWPEARRSLIRLSVLAAACVLATFVNPYGYHLYQLAANVLQDRFLTSIISELEPPNLQFVWILEGTILTMAAAALRPARLISLLFTLIFLYLVHLLFNRWANPWAHTFIALPVFAAAILRMPKPGRLAHLLLACFFSQQAIHHVRHLPLMAIVILPSLAWSLEAWALKLAKPGCGESANPGMRWRARLATLIALAWLACFWSFGGIESPTYAIRNLLLLNGERWEHGIAHNQPGREGFNPRLPTGAFLVEGYPEQTVNFLLRARLPGRLWNGGNYAGYLIWRFSPERYKLFTDNRYDIYGGKFIREELSVREGLTREELDAKGLKFDQGFYAWNEVLDHWGVQTLFVHTDEKINAILADNGWSLVYEDFNFILWVRDVPENQEAIQRARALPRPRPWLSQLQ